MQMCFLAEIVNCTENGGWIIKKKVGKHDLLNFV